MHEDAASGPAVPPEQGGTVEEELAYRLRQQKLTADYGRYALRTHKMSDLLQEATRVCAFGLQSEFCKIMEYLPEEKDFIVRAGVGWKPGVVGQARLGADMASPTGYAYQTGEPVISNHLAAETRFRTPTLLAEHGVKRAINVLIQGDGSPYGILEVDSPVQGRFTASDLNFLQGFANLLGVAIDRQGVEEALRASETRLTDAKALQEILTREISHRVKNSLGMVAALLSMQKRKASDPNLQRALDDARTRVVTIAMVHDRLWRADEVNTVNLAEFMGELCDQIRSLIVDRQTLTCKFEPVSIATDQAVQLALLTNELLTNALKYAYPSGEGDVHITVQTTAPGQLRLTVSDKGKGLPQNFDVVKAQSLGMTLVASMIRQLDGRAEWSDTKPGTSFSLDFAAMEWPNRQDGAAAGDDMLV